MNANYPFHLTVVELPNRVKVMSQGASVVQMHCHQALRFRLLVLTLTPFLLCIACSREKALFHFEPGSVCSHQGKWDKAIGEYRKALELDGDYANAHYSMGLALTTKGGWDGAIAEYRQDVRLEPNSVRATTRLELAHQCPPLLAPRHI
jgi:tetratricopeptide (TPR) repeat protein